jgi:hypothetical protein
MGTNDRDVFFQMLEDRGEAAVRADMSARKWGEKNLRWVNEWLLLKEQGANAEQIRLQIRAVEAAERQALTSKLAAWAAGLSLVVSIAALIKAW